MARRSLSTLKEISEINMTPLMDLTFILLITFIITFPLIEQGIPINLPKGEAQPLEDPDYRTVSLDEKGLIFLDAEPVTLDGLKRDLQSFVASSSSATVYIRADKDLEYGKVMTVMQGLHEAGVVKLALVTQAESP